jgi:transcription elongation GreA/GreB family factor
VAALERAAKREAAERRARQAEIETTIEELDRLSERLGAVRPARPAG